MKLFYNIKLPLPPPHAPYAFGKNQFDEPWRTIIWSEPTQNLLRTLNGFQPGNLEVNTLRILLHGPVGAGKSSFINSVDSCLRGLISTRALPDAIGGESFTLGNVCVCFQCKTYKLRKDTPDSYYPFTFTDVMGLSGTDRSQTDNIIQILHGRIRNDYTVKDPWYNKNPSLKDKIHCLVSVLPADTVSLMKDDVIGQMRQVRKRARDLGIPQVIIMTKVDEACPLVKANLKKVYTSKKIKEKMEECSVKLGVPMNCIFPVKNCHEEDANNTKIDILILKAVKQIVHFANDYVEDQEENE
ncbi:putative interferon-induced protein 44 [Triplophysa rosa]|uniref:Interferon-induced protein 44 n=1 Tax=Triplophysa rosa TaxID=992332 RepID=A0A9W7WXD4_TRIRA|nr:putative interferon-induced protein 44 [Triplophysa rosa]